MVYVETGGTRRDPCSLSRRRKVPSALAASIPLNAVWIRPANLRPALSDQFAISGTTWAMRGV
jgi:hypothetical protein